jgi:UDP-GlcNAc:undecaprenyl-phosphate GlcNAc-1-phosphate transferase
VAVIVAGALALALTPLMAMLARRLGVVDEPGPLKVQRASVPYLGGVAVGIAVAAVVGFDRPSLLIPLTLALALGVADDVVELGVGARLTGELLVGLAAAAVVPHRGPLGALATVAFAIVLLNAVNLLDGLDGLASGVVAVAAVGFALVHDGSARTLAWALAGALLGFLVWNRPPARIYLGDGGSYLLGTALALLLAMAYGRGQPVDLAAGALLLVAVPVADTSVAIVRRWRARRPLFAGDRGHIYDQLVDRGWSTRRSTLACVLAQVVFTGAGVGITALPPGAAVASAATVVVVATLAAMITFTSPVSWSAP